MFKNTQLILIDLDGTLVDSVPDLAHAVDAMLSDLGRPVAGEDRVRLWVGNGIERLVKRALTGELDAEPDSALYDQAFPVFYRHYQASNGRYSRLFPGIAEGLVQLAIRGYDLACVTNKAEAFTVPLLQALGIHDRFSVIVSGDTLEHKKPHPAPLLHAANARGVDAANSLMVGDSRHDVEAARRAGFGVACVTYGYNHGDDIRSAEPDAIIDSLAELPALLG